MDPTTARDIDYETPNDSQFSLREIWDFPPSPATTSGPTFQYTSIAAIVDGEAYTGKLSSKANEVDDSDVLGALRPADPKCIYPVFNAERYTKFEPSHESPMQKHHFKSSTFTCSDCQDEKTFVADCMQNEILALERLKAHSHRNIVTYLGCVVKDGYVVQIVLRRYSHRLEDYIADNNLHPVETETLFSGLWDAVGHLTHLGLAHNDVNPGNVCVDEMGQAILLDFDACLPLGERLRKGGLAHGDGSPTVYSMDNDWGGMRVVRACLVDVDD